MLKKLYVTYLVPFKTVSVKETEELQRFFDSISETDFQFVDVGKLLQETIEANEHYVTSMDKLVPMEFTTIDDDLVVVIDFRRFFSDSVTWSDQIQKFDIDKTLKETINPEELVKINLDKAPFFDAIESTDQFEAVVSFIRGFNDSVGMLETIQKKDITKTLYSALDGVYDTMSMTSNDYEYAEVYLNDYFTIVNQFIRRFDDAVSFQHRLFKDSAKLLRDTQTIGDSYVAKDYTTKLYDATNTPTDRPYITTGLIKNDSIVPPTDILTRIVNYFRTLPDSITTSDQIQKFDSVKKLVDSFTQSDAPIVSYSGIKKDVFLYQPDEDGLLKKDTYIDAQYYENDYIDSVNLAFKTIYELLLASDSVFVVPNYGKFDSVTSGDAGGNLLNNTYMDSGYASGNYIGTFTTF